MKLGLVLEGGASRAYFTSGVLDAMLEADIRADYVIGASAGIANGLSYVSGQHGRNLAIARGFLNDRRYMGLRHLLNPKNRSLYNMDFVFGEIPNVHVPFDYDAYEQFPGEVYAAVTNVLTGQAEYLPMPRTGRDFTLLRATCALPLLFPVIEYRGTPYMDGGIASPIPVDQALRAGCDRCVVVLTRERGYRKKPEKALRWAARKYRHRPEFAQALLARTETYNEELARVERLESEGRAFVIAPQSMDGVRRTEKDPDRLTGIHMHGVEQFQEALPALRTWLSQTHG